MRYVTGLAILGCWLAGGPGLLVGVLAGMVLDDARRGSA